VKLKSAMRGLFLAAALFSNAAWAGPYADFESEVRDAYASYRAALFQTNKSDKAATEAALDIFSGKWTALTAKWGKAPPPQYIDDRKFGEDLAAIAAITKAARDEATKGELAKSHETLEKIRDLLSDLRERNGVTTFSDRMNAYHAMMEVVVGKSYDAFSTKGLGEVREDAAVLASLFAAVAAKPPADAAGRADYAPALVAIKASVEALLAAARAGDGAATKKAIEGLKRPYSMFFLKFG
jgi:hypothetical protein